MFFQTAPDALGRSWGGGRGYLLMTLNASHKDEDSSTQA